MEARHPRLARESPSPSHRSPVGAPNRQRRRPNSLLRSSSVTRAAPSRHSIAGRISSATTHWIIPVNLVASRTESGARACPPGRAAGQGLGDPGEPVFDGDELEGDLGEGGLGLLLGRHRPASIPSRT